MAQEWLNMPASGRWEVLMLYVLRRKSDGKYWRNTPSYPQPDHWVDDVSACKPFLTIAAAKTSRGAVRPTDRDPVTRRWFYTKSFDDLYEAVPVVVRLA